MKRIYSLLLLTALLASATAWSQTTYTWQGANDASWQVATNWTPTRTTPAASDILLFNTGGSRRITNLPTDQTVSKLTITNTTTMRFASVTGLQTLRIGNGVATAGDEFVIEDGSALIQENTFNEIRLQNNASAGINGTYTIQATEGFYLNNAGVVVTVPATGRIINQGGINGSSATKLVFAGGTYEHLQNGGDVPVAAWNANSTCEITGMTSTYPDGMDQTFVNVKLLSAVGAAGATMTSNLTCTNLTISNTGTGDLRLTSSNADRVINVAGAFSMTSGNFVLVNANGDGTLNVTGGFSLSGGVFTPKEEDGLAAVNVTGDFSHSGGTLDLRAASANSTATVTVAGNFTLSGTALFDMSGVNGAVGTLNVAKNFTQSGGTLTETATGNGVVNFTGTTVRTFSKTAGTISNTINFNVTNGAKLDFGTSVLTGSTGTFSVNGGGKIITSNANGLTQATGSIQMTNRSFASTADYEFRGASTGVFVTTADPQVNNFTVNNTTTSNVTLAKPMTVNGVLELTNGYLTTTTNLLTVGAGGTSTSANGAFVNGPLAKVFTGAGISFPFYVGTVSGGQRRISANTVTTAGATSTTFTARFFNKKPKLDYPTATLAGGIEAISGCEYWTLDRSTGAGTRFNASVTLSWSAASNCGPGSYITDPTTLRVLRHSATPAPGIWNNEGNTALTGNAGAGTITSGTVTNFSPFAIGTTDADANPLPVVFGDVKAYEKNGSVHVEWSNLTEKDVAEYTIERSANGKDFTAIAKQWPTSNQNDKATYTSLDAAPGTGANYYRIKAVETTRKIIYSKILSVNLGKANFGLQLYPNPVVGNQVTISLSNIKQGRYNLRVVNTAGQDIFKQIINNQSANLTQTLDLPSSVKPGVYRMVITGENYRDTKTFIVQ